MNPEAMTTAAAGLSWCSWVVLAQLGVLKPISQIVPHRGFEYPWCYAAVWSTFARDKTRAILPVPCHVGRGTGAPSPALLPLGWHAVHPTSKNPSQDQRASQEEGAGVLGGPPAGLPNAFPYGRGLPAAPNDAPSISPAADVPPFNSKKGGPARHGPIQRRLRSPPCSQRCSLWAFVRPRRWPSTLTGCPQGGGGVDSPCTRGGEYQRS